MHGLLNQPRVWPRTVEIQSPWRVGVASFVDIQLQETVDNAYGAETAPSLLDQRRDEGRHRSRAKISARTRLRPIRRNAQPLRL